MVRQSSSSTQQNANRDGQTDTAPSPPPMTLFNYVSGFRVEKGVDHTHTSFARPSGAFYVPGSESARFMEFYRVAMARGEDLHFTERHRHLGPVVIDIDERYEPSGASNEPRRRHNDDVIDKVVLAYARQLAEFVETPDTFDVYVTEKPSATMLKGLVKDGLHIMIPGVVTRPAVQLLLRQATLPQLADAMGPLGLANRIEEVVDEAVIERNNWMMYGSRKPQAEAYGVTRRYQYDTRQGVADRVPLDPDADYVDLFSIRNKNHECVVRQERAEMVSSFITQQDEKRRRREAVQAVVGSSVNARGNTCDNIGEVERLVDMLDVARAESYNEWVRTGWCLRNIDHRLLESWVQFSKKSSKYMEGECPRLWHYMRQGGLGIGTLHMWARMDNPERYRALLRTDLSDLLLRSANTGTHNDVACVVHHMYRYDYVCASLRNRTWYEFRDHRWRESDSACSLRKRLCIEVFKEYGEMAKQVQQRAIDTNDEGEQQRLVETCQKLNGIALQLKKTFFKDNVIKECSELFHVEKFEELLDSDCNLVGFENGVYDLERQEFREGRPDDHVSFSTGINYVPYPGDNHPTVAEIKRFWEQIHPDPDIRSYVMRTLSDCLSGHITHERFNIWTGTGSNGKSLSVALMEKSFGDYCCKFPVTLLTGKRAASNAASGEIARAKGRRFAVLQEPSEDEHLNIGLMKELSGGDKIQCRELYKSPVEWRPQFKLFLLCNHLPSVPSDDGGTWRRIRVVEFGSKFVQQPTRENEFPMDTELPQKLEGWREHFIAMLIEYRRRFAHTKMEEPEAVLACTREYQRNNDHMADFVDSCVETAPEPATLLTLDDAFQEFKEWARADCVPVRNFKKRDLKSYIDRNMARSVNVSGRPCYRGYRIRDRFATGGDEHIVDELG